MCNVPIEKDEGCAQMMCKRCKHVFCWYCLASLDVITGCICTYFIYLCWCSQDDFLLRHYDKGPCKNKLGHSRASVIWHRTQVIGIFAGFGILLLVASPLLLLAAPCIVCCKCRFCNSGTDKLDNEEDLPTDDNSWREVVSSICFNQLWHYCELIFVHLSETFLLLLLVLLQSCLIVFISIYLCTDISRLCGYGFYFTSSVNYLVLCRKLQLERPAFTDVQFLAIWMETVIDRTVIDLPSVSWTRTSSNNDSEYLLFV